MDNTRGTVVIKIGTDPLGARNQPPDAKVLAHMAHEIVALKKAGFAVAVVSSGAVGSGRGIVSEEELSGLAPIIQKQVWAAHGQTVLMEAWGAALKEVGLRAAQALWTRDDLNHDHKIQDAQNFMEATLALPKSVPIINGNDTADSRELKESDNDQLSGLIIENILMPRPVKLIIVTGVQGVYTQNPADHADAELIPHIYFGDNRTIDTNGKSNGGTGGMGSKLNVAFRLAELGVTTHIVSLESENPISDIVIRNKSVGTTIHPAVAHKAYAL